LESLEEKLSSLLPVRERIQWGLCQQNRVFLGRYFQIVEYMAPQKLHIWHVNNDSMLDWVGELKDTLIFLDGITNINILLIISHHDSLVLWSPDTIFSEY
jgi:hypothetical protein